jgi:sulfate permease, SulP family
VTLASLMFMARMSESVAVTAEGGDDASQRDQLPPGVEVFRINGPFFFGVAGQLLDGLRRIGRTPRAIILRLEQVPFLDASGAMAFEEFLREAKGAGVKVILSSVAPEVLAVLGQLQRSGRSPFVSADDYEAALALAAEVR